MASNSSKRVAVIGGGISGLAAAHRLIESGDGVQVVVYEAEGRLGGVLQTERQDGFLIEQAADSFLNDPKHPWAQDLAARIGFQDELIQAQSPNQRALVVFRGRTEPVPEGFQLMGPVRLWPVIKTPILGITGKARLAVERFVPAIRDGSDETLEQFSIRRLGRQTYQRLIQPLVGGIYSADPTKLSMNAALPQFVAMERQYGSISRALRSRAAGGKGQQKVSGARYAMFLAPRGGMSSFVDAIARRIPSESFRMDTAVSAIERTDEGRWRLSTDPRDGSPVEFDAVILAIPAPQAARLTRTLDQTLSQLLAEISYTDTVVVSVGFRRDQISHPLNAFGIVVPSVENRRILAISFSSLKFADRAPDGAVLLRVFVGGALQPEMFGLSREELESVVLEELRQLIGTRGEPLFLRMTRWESGTPQYHVGHVARVEDIEERLKSLGCIAVAGNAYRGIGIPQCIHSGQQAAQWIMRQLT